MLAILERFAEAEPHTRAAVAGIERRFGLDHPSTASARVNLGRALAGLGRFTDAEHELLGAELVFASAGTLPAGAYVKCLDALVTLYARWEKDEPGRGAGGAPWKAKLDSLPTASGGTPR